MTNDKSVDKAPELVEVEGIKIEFPFPEEYLYTNAALVSVSNWDFRISFAELLPSGKPKAKIGIVMTPAHAKALMLILAKNVQGYESRFGELTVPIVPPESAEEAHKK